jgi:hypothetical protein
MVAMEDRVEATWLPEDAAATDGVGALVVVREGGREDAWRFRDRSALQGMDVDQGPGTGNTHLWVITSPDGTIETRPSDGPGLASLEAVLREWLGPETAAEAARQLGGR